MARKGKSGVSQLPGREPEKGGKDDSSDNEHAPSSPWEQAWDATMSSSAAGRAKGVKALASLLQSGYQKEVILEMEQRVLDLATSSLSARKPDRAVEAAIGHLLALVFVTLGSSGQELYDALLPLLQERAREGKARAACAQALACGAVANGSTDHDRLGALRGLAGLWLISKGDELETALRGWCVVMTTVDVRTLSTPLIDTTLEHLAAYLSSSHVGVRGAAGEALGLLYTMCGLEVLPDDDDDLLDAPDAPESDIDTTSVAGASWAGSLDTSSCGVSEDAKAALQMGFDSILGRMEALSKNRGDAVRRSKGDRRASRRAALATLSAMTSGGLDSRAVTVALGSGGHRVELSLLSQRVVYRELAAVLQGGMQAHLRHNPLLHELLGMGDAADSSTDAPGGKAWRTVDKSAKASTKSRHKASIARMAVHMMDS